MGQRIVPDNQEPHVPVLLAEVLDALRPLEGALIVDGTFGAGGYSRALLDAGARVVAIDRDPNVAPHVERLQAQFPQTFQFVPGTFSELDQAVVGQAVDGVVLDIGVSSMQLDEADRGFSFMREGPLDMRMAQSGESAADLVNTLDEAELANLLYAYGEERKSRRIAQFIVAARANEPITTTTQLARLIEKAIGRKPGDMHPATRSFQALRIAVNAEFDQLVEGLFAAERVLPEGGRLAVVTFHSLEDRIVKRFFDPDKGGPAQSRHMPVTQAPERRWVNVAKAAKPGAKELERNPRARSSILRAAVRSAAPARPVSFEGLAVPTVRGAA
ncbi:16S rRNA (cytosine(1402)-N(4))-methyltransferase RsmH [Paradevosia shaoguanensis]|uniref:Ribosomal RNA small subunit methyltransferase H n=1 Tax=Paradevosia shaoguanensis TaxID=1335043 RepID=A0AA41QMY6_9HYPH|nr:16S rRNA (cytosine(1402)-N(4))-methyltransferase RsmH [Paradevosia shaoguanensis]MCF1743347.1 16S rRNA (cytosine(1402)-N(4))-methyltransferase RsmH [Paradevosia shaoguanensis]MCI0127830.1 16S rRNA (cytosine(1402)-N(4))-methyltransferase RsmH [Paradevosia shaoguanensis]